MRKSIYSMIAFSTLAIFLLDPVSSQETRRSREEVFEGIRGLLQQAPNELLRGEYSLFEQEISRLGIDTGEPFTDSMRVFVEQIADDTTVTSEVRKAAVLALHLAPPELELERMIGFLSEQSLCIEAAGVLVRWGYWDLGSPILVENEAWRLLGHDPQGRALQIIRSACESGSPMGRMSAAYYLSNRGESKILLWVSRDVLRKFIVNQDLNVDTLNLARATDLAYNALSQADDVAGDTELMEAGLSYPVWYVRYDACGALWRRALRGETEAREVIERAATSSPYLDVRERLLQVLYHIDSH